MKITKFQLKQIIKEEFDKINEKKTKVGKSGQERVSKKIGHLVGKEGMSQEQAAAVAYSMESRDELKKGGKHSVTESTYKQVIKEELSHILQETWPHEEASRGEVTVSGPHGGGDEPVESRIDKLENLVYDLLQKLLGGGPPIDPEDFTPFREGKEHPGKTCAAAHHNMSHKEWARKRQRGEN